jgi:hypothetical protein
MLAPFNIGFCTAVSIGATALVGIGVVCRFTIVNESVTVEFGRGKFTVAAWQYWNNRGQSAGNGSP